MDENLTEEEQRVLKHIHARTMMRTEDTMNIASFNTDVIDGFGVRLARGSLGLQKVHEGNNGWTGELKKVNGNDATGVASGRV